MSDKKIVVPEAKTPAEIKDLLWDFDSKNVEVARHNNAVEEAFLRGKNSR